MRLRRSFGVGVAVVAAAVAALLLARAGGGGVDRVANARADCSAATATQLLNDAHLNGFLLPNPVLQLLCGPFTGPGSQAMAVVVGPLPTCWPSQEFAVFRFVDGAWKLVLEENAFLVPPLVALGADIRETAAVHRPGDPRCIPSGGTHARVWHWDGARLVPGAWKQVAAPEPLTEAQFYSPSTNIDCGLSDGPSRGAPIVVCWTRKPPQRVQMNATGRLRICRGSLRCSADFGERPVPRKLAYGKEVAVGRFRCSSQRSGVRCVVARSGKGFLINAAGITRVG